MCKTLYFFPFYCGDFPENHLLQKNAMKNHSFEVNTFQKKDVQK